MILKFIDRETHLTYANRTSTMVWSSCYWYPLLRLHLDMQ